VTNEIPADGVNLRDAVESFEGNLIEQALARTGGNKAKAARLLNVSRTTLVEKVKRMNSSLPDDMSPNSPSIRVPGPEGGLGEYQEPSLSEEHCLSEIF
jgi:hypothetical protein